MTQKQRVLDFMKRHGSITPVDAFTELGVMRLSAVVFDLKRAGYPICTEIEQSMNRYDEPVRYARYRLKSEE